MKESIKPGAERESQHRRHQVRNDIEGLRALAVLSVLINHAFPKALPGGFVGVDIFFVISGYLIGRHLLQDIQAGHLGVLRFYAKRARRIFPALALVLICVAAAGWAFFTDQEFVALGRQMMASVLFSNNFVLWSQSGYFDTTALDKPLLHLWSLGIEEQFYLLVPALLWLGSKGTTGSIRWVARLGALSLMSTIILSELNYAGSFYLLHTRFWELAAGVLLAQAVLRMQAGGQRALIIQSASQRDSNEIEVFSVSIVFSCIMALVVGDAQLNWNTIVSDGGLAFTIILAVTVAWLTNRYLRAGVSTSLTFNFAWDGSTAAAASSIAGILLIGISIAALTSVNWPGAQTLLPVLGAMLLIGAGSSAPPNRFLARKPLALIGGISYPLYLWHWPAIVIFKLLVPNARAYELVMPLILSFVLAWLTKSLVEDPVRFGRLGKIAFRRPSLRPVVLGLAIAGIFGSLVVAFDGVPSRYPPNLRAVAEWSDHNSRAIDWRIGQCYLPSDSTHEFSNECTPIKRVGVPLVLLWGDSHAAHLYSGMAALQSSMAMDIAQWSMVGCPPLVTPFPGEGLTCVARTVAETAKMTALKPDTIVVAGAWARYLETLQKQEDILGPLSQTIHRLKELGLRHIVVFGPGPLWTTSLPVDLIRFMVRNRLHEIPARIGRVSDAIWKLDAAMAAQAAAEKIEYVSVLNYFCDKTGCLTVGDSTLSRPDLLYSDRDHLTVTGSKLLIAHARSQLFEDD